MLFPTTLWSKKYLLLDNPGLTNAVAAYSSRKLRTAYTGSAMRVRRSNDNAEQDIGFTATGLLDTAALLAFTGSNNGYVTKWYDQSTGGNDVVQSTATAQPQIVSSGSVLTGPNSRPRLTFNGLMWLGTSSINSNVNFEKTDPFTSIGCLKITNLSSDRFQIAKQPFTGSGNSAGWYTHFQSSTGKLRMTIQEVNGNGFGREGSTVISSSTNYIVTSINNGGNASTALSLRVNAVAETMSTFLNNLSGSIHSSVPLCIGSRQNGTVPTIGDIMEFLVWPAALSGVTLLTAEQDSKLFFNL